MDGSRFDNLARSLASLSTRRRFFAGLAGGTLGLAGLRGVGAAGCKAVDQICREHANCCSGRCRTKDDTGRRRCECPAGTTNCGGNCVSPKTGYLTDANNCGACGNKCPRAKCQAAVCTDGNCGFAPDPKAVGKSCGDKCTAGAVCQANGSCAGGTPKICDDKIPCTIDTCDPQTGQCVFTPKVCDDNNACTTDSCDVATGDCVNQPIAAKNPDLCTIRTCDTVRGIIDTPRNCEDGNKCTIDTCDLDLGCIHTPKNCDDNNPCTTDSCDPATGNCIHIPIDELDQGLCEPF